jgi:hypothetical protein
MPDASDASDASDALDISDLDFFFFFDFLVTRLKLEDFLSAMGSLRDSIVALSCKEKALRPPDFIDDPAVFLTSLRGARSVFS